MHNIPFFHHNHTKSFLSGLIRLFESFSKSTTWTCRLKGWIIWQVKGKHDSNKNVQTEQCCKSSFIFIHWLTPVKCASGEQRRDTWLGTSNLPPSKEAGKTSIVLLKSGGKTATVGLSSQIKSSSALFSLCFDKKIAHYSQFICLCPLLVPEAAKRWLTKQRVVGSYHTRAVEVCMKLEKAAKQCIFMLIQKKKSIKLPLHENSWAKHCCFKTSALQAQQVQISPRTIKEKTQTHSAHFKAVDGI